jgi:hypothetical protein
MIPPPTAVTIVARSTVERLLSLTNARQATAMNATRSQRVGELASQTATSDAASKASKRTRAGATRRARKPVTQGPSGSDGPLGIPETAWFHHPIIQLLV